MSHKSHDRNLTLTEELLPFPLFFCSSNRNRGFKFDNESWPFNYSHLYITNAKMGRVLTIEEFSNTAWRAICGASVDSNRRFKLDNES